MQILVNSDNHIDGSEALALKVRGHIEHKLQRFDEHLTRIEVHLNDENGHKHGAQDKRCQVEARVKGREPISVTHNAESVHLAYEGAVEKLSHALDRIIGKAREARVKQVFTEEHGNASEVEERLSNIA
ncbi:MAG: HPF/RaiA family ribosome-associated protein [Pseudomonas sp.]|uniref:HPF/RaiA family ribosome-associated protein n=1 Tax=Pseudomonas sp. TaxID=306 RepID=UPI00339B0D8D